jgi:hypothetical protein
VSTTGLQLDPVEEFIVRWSAAGGSERANYQLFIGELCVLLGVEPPQPAQEDAGDNAYCFERRVVFRHGDGTSSHGFIDCYRRGAFVLEAKKLKPGGARTFDDALMRARAQAEGYARALPADEGRPPFLVVVDVGNVIELYAEFSRSGATYTPFPDPRSHRIALADLRKAEVRERLATVWTDPLALDPTKKSARVTREIAAHLAEVAKSLEGAGHAAETVAGFLTRCLFSMFAEDVELIPKGSFTDLLVSLKDDPGQFVPLVGALWQEMDRGGFSVVLRRTLPRFNGKLFKAPAVLPLTRDQIGLLIEAALADWTQVEPAIFGTLLERALDPRERHALGAHYTPRAYVERLVLPTVVEPLRQSWQYVQATALVLANEGKQPAAVAEIRAFHKRLCELRVLDPACGSGNFLYVTLEHMKRLEGEVLNQLHEFGHGQAQLETEGFAVDPHQFLGLEINPRAAAIAELVLWIGYLQWHFRTRGAGLPPQPVLKDFRNVECRDAVLACDTMEYVMDERGIAVTRWDGHTTKTHPVTGEQVPDETARVALERYVNPRRAEWPAADVVVGNPPFIGASAMRAALGDGYVEALRSVWREVPDSADFVMFWWHHAASLVRAEKLSRFGFITTNSLRQTFNRRVVAAALAEDGLAPAGGGAAESPRPSRVAKAVASTPPLPRLHLAFAIADHPWVDSADGAAVRIAMTVVDGWREAWVEATTEDDTETPLAYWKPGRLLTVVSEREGSGEGLEVAFSERTGTIHADLTIGANVSGAQPLQANGGISSPGFKLHGAGFIVTPEEASRLEVDAPIKPYRNGKDLTDKPRGVKLIDLFGYSAEEVRARWPATYQWVLERVKPERDAKAHTADGAGYARLWWLHGKPRQELRKMLIGLPRYIATTETSKHRVFQFLDAAIAPDNMLICVTLNDAFALGVLSSRAHVCWALSAGGRLGVGNDPRYNKSRCFETFPFPTVTPERQARIRALAEELDAHRKRQQALHADLTLTGMYNVLEKLKAGAALNAKEKAIHDKGLVGVLKQLHDELDVAVCDAYGWHDAPDDDAILERLVALNAERVREEAQGQVRWLRPEFQNRQPAQAVIAEAGLSRPTIFDSHEEVGTAPPSPAPTGKPASGNGRQPWPATLPEQVAAVAQVLAEAQAPLALDQLAARFAGKGPWKKRLPQLLDTLAVLGKAREVEDGRWMG